LRGDLTFEGGIEGVNGEDVGRGIDGGCPGDDIDGDLRRPREDLGESEALRRALGVLG